MTDTNDSNRKALRDEAMEVGRRYKELRGDDEASRRERERLKRRYEEIVKLLSHGAANVSGEVHPERDPGETRFADDSSNASRDAGATQLAVEASGSGYDPGATRAVDEDVASGATGEAPRPEDRVAAVWEPGDVILDEYEVKDVLGKGGFGTVYRVHHRGWDMDMAVKCPQPDRFRTLAQKETFVTECHTWMDLGLHPHVTTCHFVRVLGGIPRVFIECVEGGSLEDWIKKKKLYEGGPEKALERILDVSIQFARALHFAHEKGLVHQDIKPANVLMTTEGEVKLTDFGLARARAAAEEGDRPDGDKHVQVSIADGTQAYWSPEQAENSERRKAGMPRVPLTHATDIYSWAVSVFELFTGSVTWPSGSVVEHYLETYLQEKTESGQIPRMPEALSDLLRKCLAQKPEDRPKAMHEVGAALEGIYQEELKRAYPREAPIPPTELADVLNNKALSFLDLDPVKYAEKAEALWQEALKLDAHHIESTYNAGLHLWRTAKITDQELIRRMEEVRKSSDSMWRAKYLIGLVHLERNDPEAAVVALEAASITKNNRQCLEAVLQRVRPMKLVHVRTLEGDWKLSGPVCMSGDGRWILASCFDPTKSSWFFNLWEVSTGTCARTFATEAYIKCLALSADGAFAISGNQFGVVELWDVIAGRLLHRSPSSNEVRSVAISPDGRWGLSTDSGTNNVLVWDLRAFKVTRTLKGHTEFVTSVCLSADERWIVTGSYDKSIRMWARDTGTCSYILQTEMLVGSTSVSKDGAKVLATGPNDSTIYLWDLPTGKCVRKLHGHMHNVSYLHLDATAKWALSAGTDKTVRLWDCSSGKCLRTFEGAAQFTPVSSDAQWACSASRDNIRIWKLNAARWNDQAVRASHAFTCPSGAEKVLEQEHRFRQVFLSAQQALAASRIDKSIKLLREARSLPGRERDSKALDLWGRLKLHTSVRCFQDGWCVRALDDLNKGRARVHYDPREVFLSDLSEDGRLVFVGPYLRLYDISTGHSVLAFQEGLQSCYARNVRVSSDGKQAVSGDAHGHVKLWNPRTGECVRTCLGPDAGIRSIEMSVDGRWIMSGSTDGKVRLWHSSTGRCIRVYSGHLPISRASVGGGMCIRLTRDSSWAVSSGWDKTIRLWDVRTGQCLRVFEGHTESFRSVDISWDKHLIVSAGDELRLWDADTGQCLRTFEGHTDSVNAVRLSPCSRWILSGSSDCTLRLWEVRTGRCVRIFSRHKTAVCSISLSSDWRWLLSADVDETILLWELVWELEVKERADWDDGALPYLENFLTSHTPYATELPRDREPAEDEITRALTRKGKPRWTEDDFQQLLITLGRAGYGWIRQEGVRSKLKELWRKWKTSSAGFEQHPKRLKVKELRWYLSPLKWMARNRCNWRAGMLLNENEYAKALEMLQRALTLDNNCPTSIHFAAYAMLQLGDQDKAKELLEAARDRGVLSAPIAAQLASIYLEKNCLQEALDAIDFAIKVKSPHANYWNGYSLVLTRLDRNEEAVEAIEKAIELEPNSGVFWFNKSTYEEELSRFAEAISSAQKAIEMGYEQAGNVKQRCIRKAKHAR
jgi:WD40 repeat protein/Tfp pilus assembly protein PilF/predicted Ser/Thr protein kinase